MFSIETYVNCDLNPSEVTDSPWLYEEKHDIAQRHPAADGKWMQFYHKSQLNAMWNLAKTKYRAGLLEGIHSMKVSTAHPNPRSSSSTDGVIIFYCGPSEDAEQMVHYGNKLLAAVPYRSSSGWMSYKSDEQTSEGTRATGQKKNYLYRLKCPTN